MTRLADLQRALDSLQTHIYVHINVVNDVNPVVNLKSGMVHTAPVTKMKQGWLWLVIGFTALNNINLMLANNTSIANVNSPTYQ